MATDRKSEKTLFKLTLSRVSAAASKSPRRVSGGVDGWLSLMSRPLPWRVVVSPSNRRTFGFQWDRAEAELKVCEDRIVVAPRATTGVSRQNKNGRAAHNAWGGKNMVEQCKFNSRVTAFAAGEKAFAERGCRASLKQGVR